MSALSHLAEFLRSHALALPLLAKFAVGMAIIVGVPRLARRIRIPAVVGLLLSGIVVGPHGLDVIGTNRPITDFFAELGKLLLMFCAGQRDRVSCSVSPGTEPSIIEFGLLTTSLPLLLGAGVGFVFGYRPVAAVVLGSLLASHTLLAAPIVVRLGATRLEPIAVTFGATVVSDTLSLVVFAICVSTFQRGFSVPTLAVQLIEIAIFIPFVLFGFCKPVWEVTSPTEKFQMRRVLIFVLMLLVMTVAAALA